MNNRNELCCCGSGKKYKKCCLNKTYEEKQRIKKSNEEFLIVEAATLQSDKEEYPIILDKLKDIKGNWKYDELVVNKKIITDEEWNVLFRQDYRTKRIKNKREFNKHVAYLECLFANGMGGYGSSIFNTDFWSSPKLK